MSSWLRIPLIRPSTARRELAAAFKELRKEIDATDYKRYHKMLILKSLDDFTKEVDGYLRRLVIFSRPHFNRIWYGNVVVFLSSKTTDKCHNTAAICIDDVLRKFGKRHGFMKKED